MRLAAPPCPDIDVLAQRIRGHRLPGGHYEITAAEHSAVVGLTGLADPRPHPVFASIASLRALGVTIEELCGLCGFRLEDGPMLGEFAATYFGELSQDVRYVTTATIESIDRTHSARVGVLDRLRFVVVLNLPNGTPVVEVRYLWLLPRGRETV